MDMTDVKPKPNTPEGETGTWDEYMECHLAKALPFEVAANALEKDCSIRIESWESPNDLRNASNQVHFSVAHLEDSRTLDCVIRTSGNVEHHFYEAAMIRMLRDAGVPLVAEIFGLATVETTAGTRAISVQERFKGVTAESVTEPAELAVIGQLTGEWLADMQSRMRPHTPMDVGSKPAHWIVPSDRLMQIASIAGLTSTELDQVEQLRIAIDELSSSATRVLAHGELGTKHVIVDRPASGLKLAGVVDWEATVWSWPGADLGQMEFWRRLLPDYYDVFATNLGDAYRASSEFEIDSRAIRYSAAADAISTVEFYARNRIWEALRWCLPTARQVLAEALE